MTQESLPISAPPDIGRALAEVAQNRSDSAFALLVDQFAGLVYSACRRQLNDSHLAEDAAQAVFWLLSQKAGRIRADRLAGWLLTTCRYACANIRKSNLRRQRREQVVAMTPNATTAEPGDGLHDLLDDALCALRPDQREALVLRYLRDESTADIAGRLRITELAVRKRIERGLKSLRAFFARRGADANADVLAAVLVQQLPGPHAPIAGAIMQSFRTAAPGASTAAIARGVQSMRVVSNLKLASVVVAIAGCLFAGVWFAALSLAAAGQSSAPPPAQSSPAPAAATAQTPAADQAPASDLSTPQAALRSFFTAVAEGNRAAAYECITASADRSPTLMDAMLSWNLAQNRMTHAAELAYGSGAAVQRMVTVDTVAALIGSAAPAQINGDSATMLIEIPARLVELVPADAKPILQTWNGAVLRFQRRSGQWKFDMDHSMRTMVRVTLADRPATDPIKIQIMLDNAATYDTVTAQIQSGALATPAQAKAALDAAQNKPGSKYIVRSMSSSVVPAQ